MDFEQYMAGCLSFDVNEYFARYIATTSGVKIYTKLLSYYATNEISINHYAYCFIQRMCSHRLDQQYHVPSKPVKISNLTVNNVSNISRVTGDGFNANTNATATTAIATATATATAEIKDASKNNNRALLSQLVTCF